MAITPFSGSLPQRNDRATFSTRADSWVTWFTDTAAGEIDAVVAAFNFNATNSVSTTNDTIATGSTTITVETGKSYVVGMTVKIAYTTDATNWMVGEVTAYNSGTGSLTVNVTYISGSGTYAAWTVSLASTVGAVGDHEVIVRTGNGYGSTNTKIARFTTTDRDVGTAITYAENAADGASFTINENGIYAISFVFGQSTGDYFGISKNSAQLTTSIASITTTDIISIHFAPTSAVPSSSSIIGRFVATDVLRPHMGAVGTNASPYSRMRVIKIAES